MCRQSTIRKLLTILNNFVSKILIISLCFSDIMVMFIPYMILFILQELKKTWIKGEISFFYEQINILPNKD